MGLRDLRADWSPPSVSDDGHWTTGGGAGAYGMGPITVTEHVALSNPVVFDCVNILMDAVGQSPIVLYERTGPRGDERERANTALSYRLREQPNDEQTAIEWKREMQQAACFYPHAYAEIEWRGSEPVNVWPRHPTRIRVAKLDGGRKRYEHLEDDNVTWRPIVPANMLRIPGRSVLRYAGETLGHAISLQRYSTRLFSRGVRPAALLSTPIDEVWDQQAKAKLREEIEKEHGGPDKAGGILVYDGRLKYTPMSMTNQEAELSALLSGIVGDLARWWRIPPYMIGLLESGTVSYASVNTQGVDFVVYCLMPWLVGAEQAIQRDLIVRKDTQFVEFLTAQLLRGTTKERYEVYAIALENGIMSPNEVRRLENLNPRQGGDTWAAPTPRERTLAEQARSVNGHEADRLLESFAMDAAGRVIRREQGALARLAERAGPDAKAWEAGVQEFYSGPHARFVAEAMKVPADTAATWCDRQMWAVLAEGPEAAAAWNGTDTKRLAEMALDREVTA